MTKNTASGLIKLGLDLNRETLKLIKFKIKVFFVDVQFKKISFPIIFKENMPKSRQV
jgi:hypothetical protein